MDKLGYKSFNLISESTLHSVPHGSWILLHPFFFSCPTSWHVGSYFTSQWSKLGPLQWKAQSPNHWTAREFLCSILDWITWLGNLVTCIFFFLNHKKIILIFYSYMSYHSYIQWKYFKLFILWMQLRLSILVIYWKTNMWKVHYNSMLSHFSCVWLFATLWTVARQAALSMGFSRQEYWSELPCPLPGDLPNPESKPVTLMSPALAGGFFTTIATWGAPHPTYNETSNFADIKARLYIL